MMNLRSLLGAAATSAALLAVAPAALALPLSIGSQVEVANVVGTVFTPSPIASDGNGLFTNVTFSLNGGGNRRAAAGLFSLDMRAAGSGGGWSGFLAFCLEPDVYLEPFSNPYTVNSLGGAAYPEPLIAELWGRYRASVTNDTTAAAFQVALWELAYQATDRSLSSGAFRLTSGGAVFATAQGWLDSLDGTGPKAGGLIALVNDPAKADRQDLILQVPEPGTLALLGLGLAGIGALRRRRAD